MANNADKGKEININFEDGIIEGSFGEDLSPEELATTFIRIAHEIIVTSKEEKKPTYVWCVNDQIYSGTEKKLSSIEKKSDQISMGFVSPNGGLVIE